MVKKISATVLAGLLALPGATMAGGHLDVADLERKIAEMSKQLEQLKAIVAIQAEKNDALSQNVKQLDDNVAELGDNVEEIDEKNGEGFGSRVKLYGDFRSRVDSYSADTIFGKEVDNDTLWTNRFRLNLRIKATENVEFKGRLAMFKTWGNQSAFTNEGNAMYPLFDGNVTRTPTGSSALYVDRAFVNWNNIGGLPMWFSIGRRPTTDGPPAQIKQNVDSRLATPMAFMDWPFDGLTFGYAWDWGVEELGNSRVRFCYGRGFEAGLQDDEDAVLKDMDFAGVSWDIVRKGHRLAYIQSFMAFDLVNYPNFQDPIIDASFGSSSGMGDRTSLGDVWHTAAVYQDKVGNFNYFLAGGFSQSQPDDKGLFNDPFSPTKNTDEENGYSVYVGARYDFENAGLKVGAEYNYGSQYWLAMSPGHDDIYQSKLATRGQVFEVYTIWDLPTGEALSKYAKTFIRLGYQHYEYDYSGSGDWNYSPYDLGDPADQAKLTMLGVDPVESADQIYLTFEAHF